MKCNIRKYCSIFHFTKTFKCDNFIKILIVFIQQCRRKNDDNNKNDCKIYRLKKDSF